MDTGLDKLAFKHQILNLNDYFDKHAKIDDSLSFGSNNSASINKRFKLIADSLNILLGEYEKLEKNMGNLTENNETKKEEFIRYAQSIRGKLSDLDTEKLKLIQDMQTLQGQIKELKNNQENKNIQTQFSIQESINNSNKEKISQLLTTVSNINEAITQLNKLAGLQQYVDSLGERLKKLENHNHDDKYSLLGHDHDNKYVTHEEFKKEQKDVDFFQNELNGMQNSINTKLDRKSLNEDIEAMLKKDSQLKKKFDNIVSDITRIGTISATGIESINKDLSDHKKKIVKRYQILKQELMAKF